MNAFRVLHCLYGTPSISFVILYKDTKQKKVEVRVTEDWFTGRNHAYPEKLPATTLPWRTAQYES